MDKTAAYDSRVMSGTYLKIVKNPPKPHRCKPPGGFARWRNGASVGSIWQCECGMTWELKENMLVRGMVLWRPIYNETASNA